MVQSRNIGSLYVYVKIQASNFRYLGQDSYASWKAWKCPGILFGPGKNPGIFQK